MDLTSRLEAGQRHVGKVRRDAGGGLGTGQAVVRTKALGVLQVGLCGVHL